MLGKRLYVTKTRLDTALVVNNFQKKRSTLDVRQGPKSVFEIASLYYMLKMFF